MKILTLPTAAMRCSTRRRQFVLGAISAMAATTCEQAHAFPTEVRVVTGDDGDPTRQILQSMARRTPGLVSSTDVRALASRRGNGVYVALGPTALQSALDAELVGALLSLFTSNETYHRLVSSVAGSRRKSPITAIFAEAAPQHQLRLVRGLWPRRVSVGVLLSANTSHLEPYLRQAARSTDLQLDIEVVDSGENPLRPLAKLRSNTAVLAVPDREVYSAVNFRNILESTYRRSQPVIGFSTALVNAGALATAYSTIDDVVAQATEVIEVLSSARAIEPQYPTYWRVAINESVATSMNVIVSDHVRSLGNQPP